MLNVLRSLTTLGLCLITLLYIFAGCESKKATSQPKTNDVPFDTLAELTRLIEKQPDNADLLYKRSYQYFRIRKVNEALTDLDKAIAIEPKNEAYFHARGYYKYVIGRIDDALEDFKRSSYLSSANPETYYQLGNIFTIKKNYTEALKWYDQSIKLDPKDAQYSFGKAYALYKMRQIDDAITSSLKSLECDSTFAKSLNLLFEIYLNDKKDLERATFYNQILTQTHPKIALGYFNMGLVFYKQYEQKFRQNPAEAKKSLLQAVTAYDQAIKVQPDFSKAFYQRGYMYFKLDQLEKALADFQKTVDNDRQNAQAYFMMGSIYESYKETEQARQCYERALKINPNWQDAKIALSQLK